MKAKLTFLLLVASLFLAGCSTKRYPLLETAMEHPGHAQEYHIGPGDLLDISVWRNPDLLTTVAVRPDGKITLPLINDVTAVGHTPMQLAQEIESLFKEYIKAPRVTVLVSRFVGTYEDSIRVVGEAMKPQSLSFRQGMTVLDVMIEVGGLTEYASGNRSVLVRRLENGQSYRVRLDDLIREGDISANAKVCAGDILIIPEAWI